MQPPQPGPDLPDIAAITKERLDELLADSARADVKAGQMLTVFGVLAALIGLAVSRYHEVPFAASVLFVAGAVSVAAALVSLLLVVRPVFKGASFIRHASAPASEVIADLSMTIVEYRVMRIRILSKILLRKYRGIRRGVHLVLVAGSLALAAALIAAT